MAISWWSADVPPLTVTIQFVQIEFSLISLHILIQRLERQSDGADTKRVVPYKLKIILQLTVWRSSAIPVLTIWLLSPLYSNTVWGGPLCNDHGDSKGRESSSGWDRLAAPLCQNCRTTVIDGEFLKRPDKACLWWSGGGQSEALDGD